MRPVHYLLTGLISLLAVALLFALYHFKADRWGVFASDFESFHQRILINKLYLKTRFLLSSEHDYDCFVFGSSRVAAIDVKKLGERCYNFTHSGGLVVDHLGAVETLLDAGLEVSDVYVALDDLSYNEDPEVARLQHMRRGYPDDAFETLDFLSMFLLKPLDVTDLSLVTGQNPKVETPRFIVDPDLDTDRIRTRYQKFFDNPENTDKRFRRLSGMGEGESYYGDSTMSALRELQKLSQKHDFSLTTFFLPLHYKTYLTRDYDALLRFKRDAAEILPFRDFSGLNEYTTDNRYWRETSHFSATVGDKMVEVLTTGKTFKHGMGRRVTSANIERLEQRQLNTDLYFLPVLLRREGLMPIPDRFVQRWGEQDLLQPFGVRRPGVAANEIGLDVATGGVLRIERGDDGALRQTRAILNLRKDDFYSLEYAFYSDYPGQFRLQVRQDDKQYEGRYKEYKLRARAGQNRGLFAGYASVDRPTLRLMLGGGDINLQWSPLAAQKIRLGPAARQRAALFDREYASRGGD